MRRSVCKDGREDRAEWECQTRLSEITRSLGPKNCNDWTPAISSHAGPVSSSFLIEQQFNVIAPDYGNNFLLYVTKIKDRSFGARAAEPKRGISHLFQNQKSEKIPGDYPRAGPKDISGRIMEGSVILAGSILEAVLYDLDQGPSYTKGPWPVVRHKE